MTSYCTRLFVCGACGNEFGLQALGGTNTQGASDLDGRPADMQRSTMDSWVQRCGRCGYCSRNVSVFDERMRALLESGAYRAQVKDAALLSTFACAGMLAAAARNYADAGYYYLCAAWDADDRSIELHARHFRQEAADAYLRVLAEGGMFRSERGESEAILVDCLRRARRDEEGLALIEKALADGCEGVIADLLKFQRELIARGDRAAHRVSEAPSQLSITR